MSKALVVCLNPTFQKTYMFLEFHINQVNRELFHREDVSGKGVNVARILNQKGIENAILSHVGKADENKMIELCKNDDINLVYVVDEKSRVRTCSTILTKSGSTTELVEESDSVDDCTDEKIRKLFNKEILNYDYLIISGTRSNNYKEDLYSYFVKRSKELNKFVVLDVANDDLKRCIEYKPNIIKPNLSEFMKTFYNINVLENENDDDCLEKVQLKMKELYDNFNITSVITRGINPIWVYEKGEFYEIPIEKAEKIVNTIGCGDTISASLVANLINNYSLKEALKNAVKDAKLNAMNIVPGSLF